MNYKRIIHLLILFFTVLLSSWLVPAFVKKLTYKSQNFPLVYYSSILKELCIIDFRQDKNYFHDIKGNAYQRAKYDSLLPLMNYRQLAMNGDLPDSIDGYAIDVKTLRAKQIMFRFRPTDIFSPQPCMGVLLESMPKRKMLTLPGDYFRMDHNQITFIDAGSNKINEAKSNLFTKEMKKKGVKFPIKHYWGNPTTRKAYDEGYFFTDSKGDFYHLKMIKDRPFVKNTMLDPDIKIRWFSMSEVMDKRFYGYIFGEKGEFGILESTEDGKYKFKKIDVRNIDVSKDEITILGNMLYWTVKVSDSKSMDAYGIDAMSLTAISDYHINKEDMLWDKLSKWIFPFIISPTSQDNGFINLYIESFSAKAFWINVLLAVFFSIAFYRKKNMETTKKIFMMIFISVTGIIGIFSLMFVPKNQIL